MFVPLVRTMFTEGMVICADDVIANVIGYWVPLQEASGGCVCGWSHVAVQRLARTDQ